MGRLDWRGCILFYIVKIQAFFYENVNGGLAYETRGAFSMVTSLMIQEQRNIAAAPGKVQLFISYLIVAFLYLRGISIDYLAVFYHNQIQNGRGQERQFNLL